MSNATNTQPIVTLPKDVAEAIEELRNYSYSDSEIIATIVTDRGCTAYGTKMPVLIKYHRHEEGNIDKLMSALVNGYQVESTPEEKVREFYESIVESDYNDFERGITYGITQTVSLLGITIAGINAPTEGGEA